VIATAYGRCHRRSSRVRSCRRVVARGARSGSRPAATATRGARSRSG